MLNDFVPDVQDLYEAELDARALTYAGFDGASLYSLTAERKAELFEHYLSEMFPDD